MKTLFRWVFRIVLLLLVLVFLAAIAVLLLKDSFAKSLAEKNLRDATGMDARISRLEVGLLTPTVNLEGLKIYNTPEFGGGTFLDLPELRVEYEPGDIRGGKLHFKSVRLNLAEVDIVKNKEGKLNTDALEKEAKKKTNGEKKKTDKPGVDFGGVDTVYLSIGKMRVIDLANPANNQEVTVGIKNEIGHNLHTEAEVAAWFQLAIMKAALQQAFQTPRSTNTAALGNLFNFFQTKPSRKRAQ